MAKIKHYWYEKAVKLLEGKKITRVYWDYFDPQDKDSGTGLCFETKNGTFALSQDDEGNGPGSLFYIDHTSTRATWEVLPTGVETIDELINEGLNNG